LEYEWLYNPNLSLDPEEFNPRLTEWLVEYNFNRTHQSLVYLTPVEYIESLINANEQAALLLPILIELGANNAEATVICQTGIEEKIISKILNMPAQSKNERITIYKPQLTLLRRMLKTTTQYIFTQKILQ